MHVVTNRVRHGEREYTSTLLRRSYREAGKVRKETLANLSHLPPEVIELIRGALRGQHYLPAGEAFQIERSLPAGHVMAALGIYSFGVVRDSIRDETRNELASVAGVARLSPGTPVKVTAAPAKATEAPAPQKK